MDGPAKKRILFVDDEPNVLQGLRRMMRPMRHEWEMEFAEDGEQALLKLSEASFQVIVSDMRMPGMDGAELLCEVKKRHPQVIRFILSGQSDKEVIMKSVGPTHQFLSKPCTAEILRMTLSRAFALRDVLANANLKKLTSELKSLPSLPGLYFEIMEELQSKDFSLSRVGKIIAKDVGMTAKILQMVNSSFFGLGVRVTDPAHAVRLLGPETVKALVISVQIFSKFTNSGKSGLSLEKLLAHSMAVATLAKKIAQNEGHHETIADDAMIAGMLHDSGKLVLAENLPEGYKKLGDLIESGGISDIEAELKVFGATHAEVGAYLVGIWGLPDPIVETLAFHHCPGRVLHNEFSCLTAVHVANGLINEHENQGNNVERNQWIDSVYLETLHLNDKLPIWASLLDDAQYETIEV
ncbi:MAG: HDOD domain-containing protein [bacterium]